MIRAKFSPWAVRDLDEILGQINANHPEEARRARRMISNIADFLAEHPGLGRRVRKADDRHLPIRWFAVPKFRDYLVFYQPFNETIMVIRVRQAGRDWTRYFPGA